MKGQVNISLGNINGILQKLKKKCPSQVFTKVIKTQRNFMNMTTHIVLFKIKKQTTKEAIISFYSNLLKIKDKIPGIISISGGKNNSPEQKGKGFTEGFIIKFKDKESRDNYITHKEHQIFVKDYILPIMEDVLVFDY